MNNKADPWELFSDMIAAAEARVKARRAHGIQLAAHEEARELGAAGGAPPAAPAPVTITVSYSNRPPVLPAASAPGFVGRKLDAKPKAERATGHPRVENIETRAAALTGTAAFKQLTKAERNERVRVKYRRRATT